MTGATFKSNTVCIKLWENCFIWIFFSGTFNTTVDIKLRQWAEQGLPAKSVETGWETLQSEFRTFMAKAKDSPDHDDIFDLLKASVVDAAFMTHTWEDKV